MNAALPSTTACILRRCAAIAVLAALPAFCAPAPAQAANQAAPPVPKATSKTMFQYYMAGGVLMHPMSVGLFGVVWLVLYHVLVLRRDKLAPARDLDTLRAMFYHRDTAAAYAYCGQHPSFLAGVLGAGVLRLDPAASDHGKPGAEAAMIEAVDQQETRMSFWLNLLSVIAALSPMLGLLGTVQGMIGAFDKIGAGGMGKPELLAADIGIALITTFYGLIIGIPAMLAFFIFRGMLNANLAVVSNALTELVDLFTGEGAARRIYAQRMTAPQAAAPALGQYQPQNQPAPQPGQQPFPQYQPQQV